MPTFLTSGNICFKSANCSFTGVLSLVPERFTFGSSLEDTNPASG